MLCKTALYCAQLDHTRLCWDVTLRCCAKLYLICLFFAELVCTLSRYNFAVLCCANLSYTSLCFALLNLKLFKYFDFVSAVALSVCSNTITQTGILHRQYDF